MVKKRKKEKGRKLLESHSRHIKASLTQTSDIFPTSGPSRPLADRQREFSGLHIPVVAGKFSSVYESETFSEFLHIALHKTFSS